MSSHRHKSRKSGQRRQAQRGGRELRGESRDNSGGLNTKPFPTKTEISVKEIWYAVPGRLDPFPPRFRTTLTCAIRGAIPAGTGPLTYFARMNSPYLPFASGTWVNATPAIATLNSTGFSSICNLNLYQNYRCFASRIMVEFAPVADIDIMNVSVTPSAVPTTPSSFPVAIGQPYTKSKTIQRGQPARDCTIINKISQSTLFGVPQQAIVDDMSGQAYGTYASFPNDTNYWVVNFARADNSTTNSVVNYRVIVQFDVEFFADSSAINPETAMATLVPLVHPMTSQPQVNPESTEKLTKQLNKLLNC